MLPILDLNWKENDIWKDSCLLLIDKARSKQMTYIWVSVWWKTKTKTEGSTRLTYTELWGGLEHLKIETRLIVERFPSVMGECENVTLKKLQENVERR